MDALVFADRTGQELLPLTGSTPVSFLPVLGQPLIVHTLADLAAAGVRRVFAVRRVDHGDAWRGLGDGRRWGMELRQVISQPGETPTDVARRCSALLPDTFLALRGDVFRGRCAQQFIADAANLLSAKVVAEIDGRPAQLCLSRKRDFQLDGLHWTAEALELPTGRWRTLELGAVGYNRLASLTDYYLAHVDGLDRRFCGVSLPGQEIAPRVFVGKGERWNPRSLRDGTALIGAGCRIDPETEMHGPMVIGDNVAIDSGVFLHAAIIIPGTRVPPAVRLCNAIVTSDLAIRMDGRMLIRFTDALAEANAAA